MLKKIPAQQSIKEHIFKPHKENGNTCIFQIKWLHTYSWLSYSESLNGGLCIPCVFNLQINHNQVGKCVTSPLIKFKMLLLI